MKVNKSATRVISLVAALVLGTGCSTEAGEASTQASTVGTDTGGSSRTTSSPNEAPTVSDPLDLSEYLDKPCGLLSSDFVNELGGSDTERSSSSDRDDSGASCAWELSDGGARIYIGIDSDNSGGLTAVYKNHDSGVFEYWEPVTVSDYPGVFTDFTDDRPNGECNIEVGIREDRTVSVTVGPLEDNPNESCPRAKQVAEEMIATLQGGD